MHRSLGSTPRFTPVTPDRAAAFRFQIERERAARQGSAKDRKKRPQTANQWK